MFNYIYKGLEYMQTSKNLFFVKKSIVLVIALTTYNESFASNGMISTGYGQNSGLSGTSIAMPLDSLTIASNPAGLAKVGSRIDADIRIFKGEATNSFLSETNTNKIDDIVLIPEFGFNYEKDDKTNIGLAIYGSGLSAEYKNPILPIPGLDDSSSSISVINISPTLTKKVGSNLYLGVSPIFAYSMIKTEGIPGKDNTDDDATGVGLKLGSIYDINENFSLGATYTSKIKMSKWKKYENDSLKSSKGRMDQPEQYGVGIAYKYNSLNIGLDYLRINWSDVDFANKKTGLGYENQNVFRAGFLYNLGKLSLMTGFSYTDDFADPQYTNLLYLGPGISNKSYSLGAKYNIKNYEISAVFERQIPKKVIGTGVSYGTNLDVDYSFFILGISKKF